MDIFGALQMLGGLCLFLFGMETMGDGLTRASGNKLEKILGSLTSSVPRGVLLGCAVTAVIQSSSATTVMLVGFVNSGLMRLSQVIPVIMGANIGTTVTAWLLSLASIDGSSFFIQMLKPMSFSPIMAAIAIGFMMFTKNEKKHNIGLVLIGFAVLMYGMDIMSSAVEPLKDVPGFIRILTMFSNPVLGVLAGAVFTAAIQSSSASVGILQALCMTGSVTYGAAIPIIMGQNIGTCITAILSAIGANKGAKRVAAVHLAFNIIGTVIFLCVFYIGNAILHFDILGDRVNPANIAIIHSIIKIASTIQLLPFCKQLYAEWGIQQPDVNCEYLTTALQVVCGTERKLAVRKEILQTVAEEHHTTVAAVDCGMRRLIDGVEKYNTEAWQKFKQDYGLMGHSVTLGKLIYAGRQKLIDSGTQGRKAGR